MRRTDIIKIIEKYAFLSKRISNKKDYELKLKVLRIKKEFSEFVKKILKLKE